METVKSCLSVTQDDQGRWVASMIEGEINIPDTAQRFTSTMLLQDGHSYLFYHMPDCRWYTEALT
jgi:hypothetical protein